MTTFSKTELKAIKAEFDAEIDAVVEVEYDLNIALEGMQSLKSDYDSIFVWQYTVMIIATRMLRKLWYRVVKLSLQHQ